MRALFNLILVLLLCQTAFAERNSFSYSPIKVSNKTPMVNPPFNSPVSVNGQLKVCDKHLCNQEGKPIQLKGMSSHGIQWFGRDTCLTPHSLDALVNTFGGNILRIAMYVQEGGYEQDPINFTRQVNELIEEATQRGIYVLIDWHILNPGDPDHNLKNAKQFFTDIATSHIGKTNLIYEIANEPNRVSWDKIKRYAEEIIPVIRAIDSQAVILIGTPGWSSLGLSEGRTYQDIVNNPIKFENIMYVFHFYAQSHREDYLNALDKASDLLPLFVTEWGTQEFTGDGENDFAMAEKYIQLMDKKKICWTNWNYSDDFRSGAIWQTGTCSRGTWTADKLKPAGIWVTQRMK